MLGLLGWVGVGWRSGRLLWVALCCVGCDCVSFRCDKLR